MYMDKHFSVTIGLVEKHMDKALELARGVAVKLKAISEAQSALGHGKLASDNMEASLAILAVLALLEG